MVLPKSHKSRFWLVRLKFNPKPKALYFGQNPNNDSLGKQGKNSNSKKMKGLTDIKKGE